jgi:hypothetical protein
MLPDLPVHERKILPPLPCIEDTISAINVISLKDRGSLEI